MPIDMRKLAQEFMDEGAFVVIDRYVRSGQISPEVASGWVQQVFLLYQQKVQEAQREVKRLDAVLGRLAAVAAQGSRKRPYLERDPLVISLAHEVTTFDNWVMSIYETDLSMISYGAPERAKAKPMEIAKSMQALTQKRLAERDFGLNAAELFKRG
jgi:hypothetical protein